MWQQPHGDAPRWELPDIFGAFPHLPQDPAVYYRPYPELSTRYEREPVHPQVPAENAPDSVHFQYVHRATVTPKLLQLGDRRPGVAVPDRVAGLSQPRPGSHGSAHPQRPVRTGRSDERLRGILQLPAGLRHHPGRGRVLGHVLFDLVAATARVTTSDVPRPTSRERVEKEFLVTLEDDLEIWRYQEYVEHPALARQDARPYGALRRWARQFYEVGPTGE